MRSHFLPAVLTSTGFILVIFVTCNISRRKHNVIYSSSELMSSSGFDYYRPSWQAYDYNRPDFKVGLQNSMINGNIGFPGPVIVDSKYHSRLGPWGSPIITKEDPRRITLATSSATTSPQQDRSHLSSEQRAEAARCHGILHACENWMALRSMKMRIVLFKEGRWCTDDVLSSKACYKEGLNVDQDVVLQVPQEGEPLSDQLWYLIQQSCPIIENCPKPDLYSSTEVSSSYKSANLQVLTAVAQQLRETERRAICCPA